MTFSLFNVTKDKPVMEEDYTTPCVFLTVAAAQKALDRVNDIKTLNPDNAQDEIVITLTEDILNFMSEKKSKRPAKKLKDATQEELRAELRKKCTHSNSIVIREGITGTLGRVHCQDCGYEREWNAY